MMNIRGFEPRFGVQKMILEAAVLYAGAGFVFYRAWALQDFSKCLPASLFVIFALAAWPCFIPMSICLMTAYIVALLFFPVLWRKGLLKTRRIIWIYSLLGFLGVTYILVTLVFLNR